jgi:UDPglucose 6-dehydrogenase
MHITVIGTGYVGLVTGTCFAETGNDVVCVDIDKRKVDQLCSKKITIYEPGLEPIFLRNMEEGRLKFTTDVAEGMREAQVVFLALPTPPGEDGSADLSYVLRAAEDLARHIIDYVVIVDKSTVPVGTSEKVHEVLSHHAPSDKFDVVSNPEFLREGVAVDDFMKPDRVVVGTDSERAEKVMRKLYEPFVRQGNPVLFMDKRSAEMTKYAANAYLATRISFMNEIANLCEKLGANVDAVRKGIGSDTRIGKRFLFPGIGYGGSCFPKDVSALEQMAMQSGYEFKILHAVMNVNTMQKHVMVDKLRNYFKNKLRGKHIALWGIAFKPHTDDIREAPALEIITQVISEGATMAVFDPEAMPNTKALFPDQIRYAADMYDALDGADALIIATEWNVFRSPDFDKLRQLMRGTAIFDGRNVYSQEELKEQGVYYESIGRP